MGLGSCGVLVTGAESPPQAAKTNQNKIKKRLFIKLIIAPTDSIPHDNLMPKHKPDSKVQYPALLFHQPENQRIS
jgi:hypothetical protein